MAGYQLTPINIHRIDPSQTGNPDALSKVFTESLKGWSDFLKNNPVNKMVQTSTLMPALPNQMGGSGSVVSATTNPSSAITAPNTPTPGQATRDWMNSGPSADIVAKYGQAQSGHQGSGPGFFARVWNDVSHFFTAPANALKQSLIDNPANVIKEGPLQQQLQGSTTSKAIASAKKGYSGDTTGTWADAVGLPKGIKGNDPIYQAFLDQQKEHGSSIAGMQAKVADVASQGLPNLGLQTARAAVNFAGDSLTNPLTYVPAGLPYRLLGPAFEKLILAPLAERVAAKAATEAGTQTANIIAPKVAGAVDPQVAAQTVAQTAQGAHDATIADQLAEFNPAPGTTTHVTQVTEPIPVAPTATADATSKTVAAGNLADANVQGKPVSEGLLATLLDNNVGATVRHNTLGVVDIPTLDAHMKDIRSQLDVATKRFSDVKKNFAGNNTEAAASAIRTAQKAAADLRKEYNYSLRLKKSVAESDAAAAAKPQVTEPPSEPVPAPEESVPPAPSEPTAAPSAPDFSTREGIDFFLFLVTVLRPRLRLMRTWPLIKKSRHQQS